MSGKGEGAQLKITSVLRANFLNLVINRAICAADGIDCSVCPVVDRCRQLWDDLQENTQNYHTGIPGRYVGIYVRRFNELQREKWRLYNELVMVRGGNHGSPVR